MELQIIQEKIRYINGHKIMFDFDLAVMYGVENRKLKQAVRRNIRRFPIDFMFELTKKEWQEVITNCDNLPPKIKFSPTPPFAFTEQGVAMLSSVLKSPKAVEVNIAIMRAFVLLRQHLTDYNDLKNQVQKLEKEMNAKFKDINQALNYLLQKDKAQTEQQKRRKIGYNQKKKK